MHHADGNASKVHYHESDLHQINVWPEMREPCAVSRGVIAHTYPHWQCHSIDKMKRGRAAVDSHLLLGELAQRPAVVRLVQRWVVLRQRFRRRGAPAAALAAAYAAACGTPASCCLRRHAQRRRCGDACGGPWSGVPRGGSGVRQWRRGACLDAQRLQPVGHRPALHRLRLHRNRRQHSRGHTSKPAAALTRNLDRVCRLGSQCDTGPPFTGCACTRQAVAVTTQSPATFFRTGSRLQLEPQLSGRIHAGWGGCRQAGAWAASSSCERSWHAFPGRAVPAPHGHLEQHEPLRATAATCGGLSLLLSGNVG